MQARLDLWLIEPRNPLRLLAAWPRARELLVLTRDIDESACLPAVEDHRLLQSCREWRRPELVPADCLLGEFVESIHEHEHADFAGADAVDEWLRIPHMRRPQQCVVQGFEQHRSIG